MRQSALEGLRQGLQREQRPPQDEIVKSMCIREVPDWVHQDYRMLKALCRQQEPTLTINELMVEALREYVGVAYAKRGKPYAREGL